MKLCLKHEKYVSIFGIGTLKKPSLPQNPKPNQAKPNQKHTRNKEKPTKL